MAVPSGKEAVARALVLQFLMLLPFSIILDGGEMARMYIASVLAFWGGVGWMVIRSRGRLTGWQIQIVQYGWIPLSPLTMFLMGWAQPLWKYLGIGGW